MTPAEFHAAFIRTLETRVANESDVNALHDFLEEQGQTPWGLVTSPHTWYHREALRSARLHLSRHDVDYWRLTIHYSEFIQWRDLLPTRHHVLEVHLLLVQVESLEG